METNEQFAARMRRRRGAVSRRLMRLDVLVSNEPMRKDIILVTRVRRGNDQVTGMWNIDLSEAHSRAALAQRVGSCEWMHIWFVEDRVPAWALPWVIYDEVLTRNEEVLRAARAKCEQHVLVSHDDKRVTFAMLDAARGWVERAGHEVERYEMHPEDIKTLEDDTIRGSTRVTAAQMFEGLFRGKPIVSATSVPRGEVHTCWRRR